MAKINRKKYPPKETWNLYCVLKLLLRIGLPWSDIHSVTALEKTVFFCFVLFLLVNINCNSFLLRCETLCPPSPPQ